jgi:outer membrane immunogenic protein
MGASQLASAADLMPAKAPRYAPPPAFSWTGFYVGGHFGAGWGTIDTSINGLTECGGGGCGTENFPGSIPISSHNLNGFLGGATVGWNWQTNPWLVLGVEGDFTWTGIDGTAPCTSIAEAFSCKTEIDWMADVTGRVGVIVDRALVYVKGGAVWAHSKYTGSSSFEEPITLTAKDTRFGGLLGVGVEYAFMPNWSAKIEYNYMDFGTEGEDLTGSFGPETLTAHDDITQRLHVIKAGLNYRFWGY